MVGVEMRDDDPPHVVGREAEPAQLRTDLFLGPHPFAQAEPEVRLPGGEIAGLGRARGLAGVDDDQTLRVLDEPREDRQRLGPAAVCEEPGEAAAAAPTAVGLAGLDGDGSGLDGVDSHRRVTSASERRRSLASGGAAQRAMTTSTTPSASGFVDRASGDQEAVEERAAEQVEGELVVDRADQFAALRRPVEHSRSAVPGARQPARGSWRAARDCSHISVVTPRNAGRRPRSCRGGTASRMSDSRSRRTSPSSGMRISATRPETASVTSASLDSQWRYSVAVLTPARIATAAVVSRP